MLLLREILLGGITALPPFYTDYVTVERNSQHLCRRDVNRVLRADSSSRSKDSSQGPGEEIIS